MKAIDISKKHKVTLIFLLDEEVTPLLFAQKVALACSAGALRPGEAVMVEGSKAAHVIGKASASKVKRFADARAEGAPVISGGPLLPDDISERAHALTAEIQRLLVRSLAPGGHLHEQLQQIKALLDKRLADDAVSCY